MTLACRILGSAALLALTACSGSPAAPASAPAGADASLAPGPPAAASAAPPAAVQPEAAPAFKPLPADTVRQSREPRLGQQELLNRFSAYPRATSPIVPMGEQMVAHQVPMTLAYFETEAHPLDVLAYYAKEFEKKGWARIGLDDARHVVDHPALSATDPEDELQMSVMVVGNGPGQPRTVILSIADPRPEARVPDEGELPHYPGTSPIALRATELGAHSYTQTLVTRDPANKVAAFYLEQMEALGYLRLPESEQRSESAVELVFGKKNKVWRIRVSQQKDETMVLAVSTVAEDRP